MTIYKQLKQMTIQEFSEWLDKHGQFDGSPWMNWFDNNYCKKCEPIVVELSEEAKKEFGCGLTKNIECTYCELEHKCKFLPQLKEEPTNKEIIKMWLKQEI